MSKEDRTLIIIGMPLNKNDFPSKEILEIVEASDLIIGESKNITLRRLNGLQKEVFFLDNINKNERKTLFLKLKNLTSGMVCLFSDAGMPGLFDTGMDVIRFCVGLNYKIKTFAGPTSWGTACAISGFNPPFLILGFLPQKTEERERSLRKYVSYTENIVLLDTPYRLLTLLTHIIMIFGKNRKAFLAIDIGKKDENYFWDTLYGLFLTLKKKNIKKGEFVLIIEGR